MIGWQQYIEEGNIEKKTSFLAELSWTKLYKSWMFSFYFFKSYYSSSPPIKITSMEQQKQLSATAWILMGETVTKEGPMLTRKGHRVSPFPVNSRLSGFCNSGSAGESSGLLWLRTDTAETQGHKGSWWTHGLVRRDISGVGNGKTGWWNKGDQRTEVVMRHGAEVNTGEAENGKAREGILSLEVEPTSAM